ncbi:hypothetical protein PFICI_12474 [Pestalotiopsis fici W106-1]|uniref:Uncharacterized protein n=1 Tax=Pestalotiopsis fici (strain W106-1 / CGMCC3.15140) TaxID=1229662 RepID=W3WNN5_PESFW|nr:uncharacterized protein PFICI_12474 [Pestalotiopsis fici W106-1]ETS75530.1 hypothetical protein PFICI_12474 [Pestalotiopsis fici W106-1]
MFATQLAPDNAKAWHDVVKFFRACGIKFPETGHDIAVLVLCFTAPHWDVYMPWLLTCWKSAEDFIHSAGTNMIDLVTMAGCTYTAFTTLQPVTQPDFYHSPPVERARKISVHGPTCDHRVFRKFLHEDAIIKRDDAVEIAKEGINILSLATRSFVESRDYNTKYDQAGWNKLMQELVLKTGDFNLEQEAYSHYDIKSVYEAEARSGNPFMVCILSAINCFPKRRFHSRKLSLERHLQIEVHRWLQVLQDCEIDLEAYGQREHGMIFRKGKRPLLIHDYKETWLWTGFSWGSNPSDWVFHVDRVVERFSDDFWRLIDNPIQQVPGAWIEDEDLHSDLSDSELEDGLDDDSE